MNNISINDQLYLAILQKATQIQSNPKGLSDYQTQGKADSIVIKLNNIIILLLLELNKNLEKAKQQASQDKNIEELIEQLKKIELILPKEKEKAKTTKPKTWTFFQHP